jgi:DNA polymerase elongation subunit (family B)
MFGFETTPDIYHGLFFQMEPYLKNHIELKLKARKDLKELIKNEKQPEIKQNYEIKAELIKLMLNSCYGFTLCNLTSSKFKTFKNAHNVPKHKARRKNVKSCLKLANNCYLLELNKISQEPFATMLGHIGCTILFHSKRILLKRLDFMLKYLSPVKAQLLYMDTDSAHFLVKHKEFEDNVDDNLKKNFKLLFDKHFETGEKLSGIWVQEGFYNSAQYIGEKSYILYDTDKNTHMSHMKGLNTFFQKQFCDNNINPKEYTNISYNIFFKSPDFAIYKIYMNKNLFSNYIPTKRYFISATGSLPLKV